MARFQNAVATDMMGLKPTLASMMSAMEGASETIAVHFSGMSCRMPSGTGSRERSAAGRKRRRSITMCRMQ